MTRQEMFNKMWEQAKINIGITDRTICLYRGESVKHRQIPGYRCMVGACIADEDYDEKLEGQIATSSMMPDYIKNDDAFLRIVQRYHDGEEFTASVPILLRKVAEEYNLTIPDEA